MGDDFGFVEYNDIDAINCANGDYNEWEENQIYLDDEGDCRRDDYDEILEDQGAEDYLMGNFDDPSDLGML